MKFWLPVLAVALAISPCAKALDVKHYEELAKTAQGKDPLARSRAELALTGYLQGMADIFQVVQVSGAKIAPIEAGQEPGICLPKDKFIQALDLRSLIEQELSAHGKEYDWETVSVASVVVIGLKRKYPCAP